MIKNENNNKEVLTYKIEKIINKRKCYYKRSQPY